MKRPRGRPPLPETLKRRMKDQQHSQSPAESEKIPSSATNVDKPQPMEIPVKPAPNPPPAASPPEEAPVIVKKRRKQGPRGMARLFVNRPGSKVNGSAKQSFRPPPDAAEHSLQKHQPIPESSPDVRKPEARETCDQRVETAAEQMIPSLSSPIWQPASKRVLDAVCVTDVTACSGVTITVRESSVIDGFFRSRPEEP